MRGVAWFGLLLALGACGPSESDFVLEYTDLYCAYYLDCADPAQLVFEGMDTVEECAGTFGPGFGEDAGACKLAKGDARKCLKAMELLTCPAEGTPLDAGLPPICDTVWKKCIAQPEETESEDTGVP